MNTESGLLDVAAARVFSGHTMRRPIRKSALTILFLALAYFVTGRLGLLLPAFGSQITLIWLPTGIAVAALMRWGSASWPGISLGALAVNLAVGASWPVALGVTTGNTVGPLVAAWALRRMGFHPAFDRSRDILLLAAAAALGMVATSGLGVATLSLAGTLEPAARVQAWLTWWAGDALGVIAAAPLVLTFSRAELGLILRRGPELLLWIVATATATWAVFIANHGASPGGALALAFVPLPFVAWAALRFGPFGTSIGLILLGVGAAYGTATRSGPFYRSDPLQEVSLVWLFMATSAVLGWLTSALNTARRQSVGVQRLFEQALTDVSLGVLLAGLDRRITYANQGFTRLTGYTEAELLGRSCALLQGPETDPAVGDSLKAALHGEGFFEGEILNYRKDGSTFWNALLISPVRDDGGAMTGFLGIQRDITQRRRAELALRQSEEHLRLIIELEPECVKLLSPEGRLLEMNPAGLAMIEAGSLDEVRDCPVSDLIVPEDQAAFAEMHRRVMQGGSGRCEFAIVGLKGSRRWMETHAVPYRDGRREIIGVLGITRDVTERRKAAAELERSLSTLQLLINSVPAYISFVDVDERYRLVNRLYEEYFGLPAALLVGRRLRDVQPAAVYAEIQPHVRAALAGKNVRYEFRPTGPDGKSRWLDVQYVPRRGEDGAVGGFFALVYDITEKKLAEEDAQKARQRFEQLVSSVEGIVWEADAQTFEFSFVSEQAERLLGYPVHMWKEPGFWAAHIHPDDRAAATEYCVTCTRQGRDHDFEYRMLAADGRVVWLRDIVTVLGEKGAPLLLRGIMVDITERKRADEALHAAAEFTRSLIGSMQDGFSVLDADGVQSDVNPAFCRMTGFSRQALIGARPPYPYWPPEELDRIQAALSETMEGRFADFELTFMRRNGERFPAIVSPSAVRNQDGSVRSYCATVKDITERRRADAALRQSEAQFRTLTESAPVLIYLTDSNGDCIYVNRRWCEAAGMTPAEAAGQGWLRALHAEDRPSIAERWKRSVESVGTWGFEYRFDDRAGRVTWVYGTTAPILAADGRVIGYVGTNVDITERRRAEQERARLLRSLEESQTRLQTLVGNLPGMAYRCLNDPGWTMAYVSEGSEAVTSYRRDELENSREIAYADIVHPDDREWLWARCEAELETRTPCQHEYRIIDRDGRERWVSERASGVYSADGALVAIDGFIQDITAARRAKFEREQLDRKVQETQKLESLGVLAGGIAHDFNNLLTTILGNASIAQSELPPGSPSQDCLDQITEASMRAGDLCKQMLAYSGRGRFIVQTLDLGQLVEQTAQMLQISISKKAVLRYRLEKGLPAVEVDATQIRQVIMNLVINASEAIGDKSGVISLSTGLTRVDRDYLQGTLMDPDLPAGDYVYLEVSDSGAGMSAETKARIFDPFFTTKFTGRGLGLAAVLGIVRGHKGALKVYSEVGRGTTFKLLFPAVAGAGEIETPAPAAAPSWRGEGTVLVVDDEETMRNTMARMMRMIGLEPVLAADGREAVEIFRKDPRRFALVLLDLTMPHMDGEQTFTELRRLRPDVRVVLMSGFNSQEALVRFNGKGLANFLQKPFTVGALRAVLQDALG